MKNILLTILCALSFSFYAQTNQDYYASAVGNFKDKNYQEAVIDFTKDIEVNPTKWRSYLNRGICQAHLLNFKEATADFDKVLELDPKNTWAKKMGDLTRRHQAEKNMFPEYFNSFPNDAKTYAKAAFKKEETSDYEGAIRDYSLAIDLNPLPGYYFGRANAQYSLKLFAGAIEDFTEAIKLNKKYAQAYLNRGSAEYNVANKTAACADWQKALKLGMSQASEVLNKYCK